MTTPTKKDFWFLPLGGSGEIGMNLNLYGHDKSWLMVDCGIAFYDRLGVEVLTADPTFIVERRKNLAGLIITHAHEDHVGAIPYLWDQLKCPIYASPFTMEVIKNKLKECSWGKDVPLITVPLKGNVDIGPFHVEFLSLTHSIPEPNALAISTPLGTVVHTGDWKLDPTPLVGAATDTKRLIELGDKGVMALVCDSTNVFQEGTAGSEGDVRDEMMDLIASLQGQRVVVACFASNVARLETIALAAEKSHRVVSIVGRSLKRMYEAAQATGYLRKTKPFLDERDAMRLPPEKVLFISTGSQGESRSALAQIAQRKHPSVKLDAGDVVIFSSRMIPGNEKNISAVQNALVRDGIEVITSSDVDIHVSGHPCRDELIQMYNWIRPKLLVPVHGEDIHLEEQAMLGLENGIPHTVVPHDGTLINLCPKGDPMLADVIDEVPVGRFAYDGSRLVPFNGSVLKERHKLSINGIIIIQLSVTKKGKLSEDPRIFMQGIAEDGAESTLVLDKVRDAIELSLKVNLEKLADEVRMNVRRHVDRITGKRPIVHVWVN